MKNLLKEMLSRPIVYHPILGKKMGLSASILFNQILYWQNVKKGKEFYKTDKEFSDELGMGINEFKAAKKYLIENGFVKMVLHGIPAKSNYSVDDECMENVLQLAGNQPTSKLKSSQLVGGKSANILYTETTTETTTEILSEKENKTPMPPLLGKSSIQRVVMVYSLLWFSSYGTKYVPNFGAIGKNFKPLLDSLSEWQIAAMIVIHFNWHGADGTDEYTYKNLERNMHPILWIPSKVNEYGTYLTNVLKVDFNDPDQVEKYVKDELRDSLKEGLQAGIIKHVNSNDNGKD